MIYLDNSATTRQYDEVTEMMTKYMQEDFGNPSSLHSLGVHGERGIKMARKQLAQSLNCSEIEIAFTSGGTESDNLALFGICQMRKRRGTKVITSQIEHPAVLESCKKLESMGFQVEYLPVDSNGVVDLDKLEEAIDEKTILISIMAVNNETGTIEPLEEINRIRRAAEKRFGTDILFHTDAVQAYGKQKTNFKDLGVDVISISGHKIHGPKGIGAIYIRKGLKLEPHIFGGGQENGVRSGTENVPAIVGFGKAVEINRSTIQERIKSLWALRQHLLEGIQRDIEHVKLNGFASCIGLGGEELCNPAILNVSFLNVRGEVLLHTLEQDGIYVSTGSACASNKKGQSHVLKAMGISDKEIEGAIRFSFSEFNTMEEMDFVLEKLKNAVCKFRKLGSFR